MLIILDDSIMIAKLPRRSGTDELLITGHGRSISISGTISKKKPAWHAGEDTFIFVICFKK